MPPPQTAFSAPQSSLEERLVANAIILLCTGAEDRDHPLENLMLNQADNLLRWMSYFFTKWVFNLTLEKAHTLVSSARQFRTLMFQMIPPTMERMSKHTGLVAAMNRNTNAATLLAQMLIVFNRDKHIPLLTLYRGVRLNMDAGDHHRNQAYFPPFLNYLERHSKIFAKSFLRHLQSYGDEEKMSKPTFEELVAISMQLMDCIHHGQPNRDVLLDACLEQKEFVQTLTFIVVKAIDGFDEGFSPAWTKREESLLGVLVSCIDVLTKAFSRAGAPVIYIALTKGLLQALLSLYRVINRRGPICGSGMMLASSLPDVLGAVMIHAVYPSVFREVTWILDEFDAEKAAKDAPSYLPGFKAALVQLCARLTEETKILARGGRVDHHASPSHYSRVYRFCDNMDCRHFSPIQTASIPQLGRCTACHSGYYCSRYCQRMIWQRGHREECQKVIASCGKGFPPILTAHETEYFRRSILYRMQYYAAKSSATSHTEDNIITMDLARFPVRFSASAYEGYDGLLATARIPTGTKLGDGVEIELQLGRSAMSS